MTDHYSNAEPVTHFPMHDESVFDALDIEYHPDRVLRAWNYRYEILKSRAPEAAQGETIIDFDWIYGHEDMPDDIYESLMDQIHNGVDVAEACEAANNAAKHTRNEQKPNE